MLLPTTQAAAAPGPAPAPQQYRVLQDIHTDAISTFLDDGVLALGTKADVAEGTGTRFAADDVWFHIDDDAASPVPAGYEFIAAAGEQVWIAPESNPGGTQLWPGFSTESVPAGAVAGDQTAFTLSGFDGPGDIELFRTGSFGTPTRLWSSDEDHKTFSVGRTHMHANWAFTAAGTYRLTVTATATAGATPMAATATYTFVVGDLPEVVATSTALTASATALTVGEPVTLTGTVTPAETDGYVEFRDGGTVLGHAPVDGGSAELVVPDLAAGAHPLTASFVPAVGNLAGGSTSASVAVTVTDDSGVEFGIAGIAESYQPGDLLQARVVGATLAEGQSFQWAIRPVGATNSGYAFSGTGGQAAQGIVEQRVDVAYDGYEVRVRLRAGSTTLSTTGWVPIRVQPSVEPLSFGFVATGPLYLGDDVLLRVSGRELAAGESLRFVERFGSPWSPRAGVSQVDATTYQVQPTYANTSGEWALQVIRDDLVVAQSAPVPVDIRAREVLVEGIQGVYRVGQTLRATGTVYPAKEGLLYRWVLLDLTTYQGTTLQEGADATALSIELPVTLDLDNNQLTLAAVWDYGSTEVYAGQTGTKIVVSDADPSTQLFFFNGLSDHYHQGSPINLQLLADPALADGDTVDWQWRWPGSDEWTTLPGASGLAHSVVAEQALDGVEVRATLTFGVEGTEPMVAEPVTIHVDDHGAAPRQQVTVTGETSLAVGDVATFTADVSADTVLTGYQWFEKAPDAAEATPIAGATGREYSFTVTAGHHSRELSVAVVTPTGQTAYGPSEPVTLAVDDHGGGVGATSQEIIAAVPDGTLVISVDANDQVLMSDFALSAEADRWVSTGELRPVRVTDARASAPGWTASGQVSDFVAGTQTLSGRFLGWTPRVVSQPGAGAVTAGASIAPAFDAGRGLLDSSPLAIGAAGARGTSELGAGLRIEAPTDVAAGTYVATITFTAI
ncbi:choice-of-anchor M domain-containing protein [Solwaraspora sp. WMMA2056]|uniref:choice-of-anchor M domain-containing protein n=1 Tax=Solwaraspora sp. WMMA2056 TaxID=3015161 RepID=UPI00259B1464|nr:choice-of-anchor M domain-containing protein [Solwaraspora sp. WMMA2056]WJK40659.1 choice-of-anchor M domain-containing protein [Solwaraspora sp. WMMA2056]